MEWHFLAAAGIVYRPARLCWKRAFAQGKAEVEVQRSNAEVVNQPNQG